MSDCIVVMNKRLADQIGTPQEIYARPRTRFLAEFIGTLNVLEARIDSDNRNILRWSGGQIALATARDATQTADLRVAIRPESLRRCPAGQGQLDGILQHVEYLGSFACTSAAPTACFTQTHLPAIWRGPRGWSSPSVCRLIRKM